MPGYGHTRKKECVFYDQLRKSITINGNMMYVGRLLEYAYKKYPDNIALLYKEEQISYKELYYRAGVMTQKIRTFGIKPKDRVLLFFENSPEFYIAYYGILQAGAVVAPLNTFLQERELTHIINDAQPKLIITSTQLKERVDAVSIPLFTQDDMALHNQIPNVIPDTQITDLHEDDMSVLLYTSGTTGLPKGVMLSSKNCMTNVIQAVARVSIWEQERIFGVLPMFHSFAQSTCVWSTLFVGCTVIVVPRIERRYILQGLQHKPTLFLGVPALYGLLCLLKTAPLDSVKCFISGGDALPDKIRAAFALIYGRKICNGYGLTEASPLISVDLEDVAAPTSNVGRPVCGITVVIKDEYDKSLPDGHIGQLCVKGDNIMLGYYHAPQMTAELLKDGWLYTGDLAYRDQEGNIIITGRIKDLIIHKGFNIYPQEIENVIMLYANVIRVGVIGREDPDVGQVPIAYVQLRADEPAIERKLKNLCLADLAPYKVPRQFICTTDNLPVTATGKVDKKKLNT